jgi:hypothetical protein
MDEGADENRQTSVVIIIIIISKIFLTKDPHN